jgi:hypothetical protein
MLNLLNQEDRISIIADINSNNNKARKAVSLKQFEVYQGRMHQFIKEALLAQYNVSTVREMPIVSCINVQRKITQTKATIYKHSVERNFTGLTEQQEEIVELVYKDMLANIKLCQANKSYVYQEQSIGQIVPINGKLVMRVFTMHQIDAVPNSENPDYADAFIISVFDRGEYLTESNFDAYHDTATGYVGRSDRESTTNNPTPDGVATKNDYKGVLNKYIVWTPEYNFMMNGNGYVIDPSTGAYTTIEKSALCLAGYDIMPFFEASREKDFEYFVRPSNSLTDFTIQYNTRMSDESAAIKLQTYSVAVLKCPSELQPNIQVVGPSMLLKLPTDDPNKEVDFSFQSPSTSITEISGANDKFLNNFLTSEGLTSSAINSGGTSERYASALDRYIAILDRMEAHADDYEVFKRVEVQVWEIVKAWLNTLSGTNQLDKKYWVGNIPNDSEIEVTYEKPKMVRTESEKLDSIQKKIDLGIMTKVEAIMDIRDIGETQAKQIYDSIQLENNDELAGIMPLPSVPTEQAPMDAADAEDDMEDDSEE